MNIAVCLCQVPDTASVIGFVDGAVDRSRVNEVMNPYDEYALEEAVRLKECFQQSIVTVFCVAPDSAREMLRKALALGADRAVRVSCPTELSDPFQTARVLSQAISAYYSAVLPDLVFCGKHSTDFQSGQVPPMLAQMLGMASVSGITALTVSGEGFQVEREIERGIEYIFVTSPVLLSAEKGLNTPRNTTVRAVMEARKKTVDLLTVTLHEEPLVVMKDIEPLERKKLCRILSDEKELIRLLSQERHLF
ncbi:MAG: electron transfer flavoprotein subunit beta/FixA family protein [Chlorobiaceae bacterium]|nr:electron transfer flavoprotein subunit beta/FixA family protein [Chlorobiaceae bacterium]